MSIKNNTLWSAAENLYDYMLSQHWMGAARVASTSKRMSTTWAPKTVGADIMRKAGERLWQIYFYRQARSLLAEERPDVLYERYERSSTVGLRLAKEFRLPLILEMNNSLTYIEQWRHKHSPLYARWAKKAEKKACLQSDRVLVVSPALESYLLDLGVAFDKVMLMPCAADPERFAATSEQAVHIRKKSMVCAERQSSDSWAPLIAGLTWICSWSAADNC